MNSAQDQRKNSLQAQTQQDKRSIPFCKMDGDGNIFPVSPNSGRVAGDNSLIQETSRTLGAEQTSRRDLNVSPTQQRQTTNNKQSSKSPFSRGFHNKSRNLGMTYTNSNNLNRSHENKTRTVNSESVQIPTLPPRGQSSHQPTELFVRHRRQSSQYNSQNNNTDRFLPGDSPNRRGYYTDNHRHSRGRSEHGYRRNDYLKDKSRQNYHRNPNSRSYSYDGQSRLDVDYNRVVNDDQVDFKGNLINSNPAFQRRKSQNRYYQGPNETASVMNYSHDYKHKTHRYYDKQKSRRNEESCGKGKWNYQSFSSHKFNKNTIHQKPKHQTVKVTIENHNAERGSAENKNEEMGTGRDESQNCERRLVEIQNDKRSVEVENSERRTDEIQNVGTILSELQIHEKDKAVIDGETGACMNPNSEVAVQWSQNSGRDADDIINIIDDFETIDLFGNGNELPNVNNETQNNEQLNRESCNDFHKDLKNEMNTAARYNIPINPDLSFLSHIMNPLAPEFCPMYGTSESSNCDKLNESMSSEQSETYEKVIDSRGDNCDNFVPYNKSEDTEYQTSQRKPELPPLNLTNIQNQADQIVTNPPPQLAFQNGLVYNTIPFTTPSIPNQQIPSLYPYFQQPYLPILHPGSMECQMVYALPANTDLAPVTPATPITPGISPSFNYSNLQPVQIAASPLTPSTPINLYNGQQFSFTGLPSAPNPVMKKVEIPPRQRHTDPPRAEPMIYHCQQKNHSMASAPVMNLEKFYMAPNSTSMRSLGVPFKDCKLPKKLNNQDSMLIDRIDQMKADIQHHLKKKCKKSKTHEKFEKIIEKLASRKIKNVPSELRFLNNAILLHIADAKSANSKLTFRAILDEIFNIFAPIIEMNVQSVNGNKNLLNLLKDKNVNKTDEPRITASRARFVNAWCAQIHYTKAAQSRTYNETLNSRELRNQNLQGFNPNAQGFNPNAQGFNPNAHGFHPNVDFHQNAQNLSQHVQDLLTPEVSGSDGTESDSLGSDSRYHGYAGAACTDGQVMSSFEESNSDEIEDSRRASLRGVSVGNRISYFENPNSSGNRRQTK